MTGIVRPHYLIDTVAAIARLSGDTALQKALDPQATLSVPIIVLAELYSGAENSVRVTANIKAVDQFMSQTNLVLCDARTAREYAQITQMLRKKGRPIPQNDIWIAALARQHSFTLVTRDAHFNNVDELNIQGW